MKILIPLIAIGVVIGIGHQTLGFDKLIKDLHVNSLTQRAPTITANAEAVRDQAWNTLTQYLTFAKAHDITGIRAISHQVSPTCSDTNMLEECNKIMDSVALIGSYLNKDTFTQVVGDDKQIIIYTEGPDRVFLYFTRDTTGSPKVLGMRFCRDDETIGFLCPSVNASITDSNENGWWDSVESLFYK